MKKLIIGGTISAIIILFIGFIFLHVEKHPLKNLNSSDVKMIKISALPPNEVKYIDKDKDIKKIIPKLRKVVVYKKAEQNNNDGQVITYTLLMKDGSRREFMIASPIVKIDGEFYYSKYAPTEDLVNLYDELNYNIVNSN